MVNSLQHQSSNCTLDLNFLRIIEFTWSNKVIVSVMVEEIMILHHN